MPVKSKLLTKDEMKAAEQTRAAARETFKRYRDDDGEPADSIDPENPPLTDKQLSGMRPADEVHPKLVVASLIRKSGRPPITAPKQPVSIRLDADIVETLKAGGAGWQTRINDILRKALGKLP